MSAGEAQATAPGPGLAGKRVLVTGGTRGIGRATALAFAAAGSRLVVAHRTTGEDARTLADELSASGAEHHLVRADVSTKEEPSAWPRRAAPTWRAWTSWSTTSASTGTASSPTWTRPSGTG